LERVHLGNLGLMDARAKELRGFEKIGFLGLEPEKYQN
jgi:hypothetical protein